MTFLSMEPGPVMVFLSCALLIVEVSVVAATEKGKTFRASIWSSFLGYITLIMSPDNISCTKLGVCHAGAFAVVQSIVNLKFFKQ